MSADKILAVYAKTWLAPIGEPNPDPDSIGFGASWGGNWAYLGDTLEKLSMNTDVSREEVKVQQTNAPVCVLNIEQKITLKTVLARHALVNYQHAFGGTIANTPAASGVVGRDDLTFGGETTVPEYKFGFETKYVDTNGVSLPWRYFFHRGSFSLDGDIDYDSEGVAGIPILITILNDTSLAEGAQTGIFQHVTAPALP